MTSSNNPEPSRPGMLGDGTEEQNLDQAGDPAARVTKDDVEAAFDKSKDEPAADKDDDTAKAKPADTLPKDNSHNFT